VLSIDRRDHGDDGSKQQESAVALVRFDDHVFAAPEARINWHNHVDLIYNLIRGCDPAPGAWTFLNGKRLQLFDVRKHVLRKFSPSAGDIGAITAVGDRSLCISAQGGQIEVSRIKYGEGEKRTVSQFCAELGLGVGTLLGT